MKAKLAVIGTALVYDPDEKGYPKMNMADICVEFTTSKKEYCASVVFPLDGMREKFDETKSAKSEIIMKYLMKSIARELDRGNEKDADVTDVENVARLKIPYLLQKAINYERVVQVFGNPARR